MTARRALFEQGDGVNPQHTAEETRMLMSAALGAGQAYDAVAPGIGAIARGHGVIGSGSLAVTPNGTPNNHVFVAAGIAGVRGTQENDQHLYVVGNDGAIDLTVAASPTNPRRDLVIAQVRDDQYPAFTQDDWVATIVQGTPAGSPVDPAVPEDALVLARLRVPTGVSAVISLAEIDDLRPRVVATGGVTPVATLAAFPSPMPFDPVWSIADNALYIRNAANSAWVRIGQDLDADWTAYTPTLDNATIGNGTRWGRWKEHNGLITAQAGFQYGSTSVLFGNIGISIPVAAKFPGGFPEWVATAWAFDISANAPYSGGGIVLPGTPTKVNPFGGAGSRWGSTTGQPFVWAAGTPGDSLSMQVTYEPV
jgi:hypothetical protein